MAFATHRKLRATLPWPGAGRFRTDLDQPQRLFLPPAERPCKATVRIYVGTEPAQYRAERVFVWSVLRHRDPARGYEIYLMRDLTGFDRRGWVTGFTNYRFAIPHYAGADGRAIYNDVDQIYLRDPGELFDTSMNDHGFLSIHRADTSVMLIDCAKMAAVWKIEQARRQPRKVLETAALGMENNWGALDPHWNARDEEYAPGKSKLVHFTTLHTQPWEPFPKQYVYQSNPVASLWHDLEASADAAGYELHSSGEPSDRFQGACAGVSSPVAPRPLEASWLRSLAQRMQASSVVIWTAGNLPELAPDAIPDLRISYRRLGAADAAALQRPSVELALCHDTVDRLPEQDWPWIIEELFASARAGVVICGAGAKRLERAKRGRLIDTIRRIARRHPKRPWRYYEWRSRAASPQLLYQGGPLPGHTGFGVWILSDGKPGHDTQSIGLARALGWPYEVKQLRFGPLARLQYRLLGAVGAIGANRVGVARAAATQLVPPWPDLVIATGWGSAPVARWISRQSLGATRVVQLGRRGGRIAKAFDYVVGCRHYRLPYASNRLLTVAPLNRVSRERLANAAQAAASLFANRPRPHIVALIGGRSRRFRLDVADATELGKQLRQLAVTTGGWVVALASRRTGTGATEALASALGDAGILDPWTPNRTHNPYEGCLARADRLVVTGESESMLAEAASTGKPVAIFPLPEEAPTWWNRLADAVAARAQVQPRNRRGTIRPQQGMEYLCARLLEKGIIQPRRDLRQLHQELIARGIAGYLGAGDPPATVQPLREADDLAAELRHRMGLSMSAGPTAEAPKVAAGDGSLSRASAA